MITKPASKLILCNILFQRLIWGKIVKNIFKKLVFLSVFFLKVLHVYQWHVANSNLCTLKFTHITYQVRSDDWRQPQRSHLSVSTVFLLHCISNHKSRIDSTSPDENPLCYMLHICKVFCLQIRAKNFIRENFRLKRTLYEMIYTLNQWFNYL